MIKEIWRAVVGYEGLYEVSNFGRVMSLNYAHTGEKKLLKFGIIYNGYRQVQLSKDGKRSMKLVHRLVAEAFIPNPNNYPCVNHKDERPENNCVENLEWCTYEYNINYGTANERRGNTHRNKKYHPANASKRVIAYKNGVVINEYSSYTEASKDLNCCISAISGNIKHPSKVPHVKGYTFSLKDVS